MMGDTTTGTSEEHEKERGFVDKLKGALSFFSSIVSASLFPPIAQGAEIIMDTIDRRIVLIEKRIVSNLSSLLIIGFGGAFLIFALLSYLRESLAWSNAAAFFSIGITIFVIGLLLRVKGPTTHGGRQ